MTTVDWNKLCRCEGQNILLDALPEENTVTDSCMRNSLLFPTAKWEFCPLAAGWLHIPIKNRDRAGEPRSDQEFPS